MSTARLALAFRCAMMSGTEEVGSPPSATSRCSAAILMTTSLATLVLHPRTMGARISPDLAGAAQRVSRAGERKGDSPSSASLGSAPALRMSRALSLACSAVRTHPSELNRDPPPSLPDSGACSQVRAPGAPRPASCGPNGCQPVTRRLWIQLHIP